MTEPEDGRDLLELLEELRVIAGNGLEYADDPYDRERYERLFDLTCEYYGEVLDRPPEAIRERLADEVGHATPKVGADAAVFDDEGRLLLVERTDDGTWCLPCGYVEAGESPAEAAVRETREETGVEVSVVELIDVYTRRPGRTIPHTLVHVAYLCDSESGTPVPSHEAEDARYRRVEDVSNWHADHRRVALDARERRRARVERD